MTFTRHALILAVLACLSFQCAHGFVHTTISSMSKECQSRYNDILTTIPAPTLDGEQNCTDLITNATANTDGIYCPASDILVACFQVITQSTTTSCYCLAVLQKDLLEQVHLVQLNETAWESLINDCEDFFSPAPNCVNGGIGDSLTGSDCKRPRQSQGWWLLSATNGKIAIASHSDFGTGIVPNAGSDWQTVQGEGVSPLIQATTQATYAAQFWLVCNSRAHTAD